MSKSVASRVVDADGHVLEPPDLWERYLEAEYRDRAIRIVRDDAGLELLMVDVVKGEFARGCTAFLQCRFISRSGSIPDDKCGGQTRELRLDLRAFVSERSEEGCVQPDERIDEHVLLGRGRGGERHKQHHSRHAKAQMVAYGPRRGVTCQSAVNLTRILQI